LEEFGRVIFSKNFIITNKEAKLDEIDPGDKKGENLPQIGG
jgi:hypothetical protein